MNLGLSGYAALFGMTLLEQLGLPLPAAPLLVAAGVMIGAGRLSFAGAFACAALGSLIGDLTWYRIGMIHGRRVLRLLSRTVTEPEACARQAEERFAKNGELALLLGKFIPGVSVLIRPMAAVAGVRPVAFLAYDAAGTALHVGTFMVLGAVFSASAQRFLPAMEKAGWGMAAAGLIALCAHFVPAKAVALAPSRR